MYIVGFNGSGRRDGNTAFFIREVFKPLEEAGHDCELVQLGGEVIQGCTACMKCWEEGVTRCIIEGDIVNECIDKMYAAAAIIIGSPTYVSDVTAQTKALIERAGYVARANGNPLEKKVGAGISVANRGGAIHTFLSINLFFLVHDMIVPGSSYWNVTFGGRGLRDGERDTEGIKTMQRLGENITWILDLIHR